MSMGNLCLNLTLLFYINWITQGYGNLETKYMSNNSCETYNKMVMENGNQIWRIQEKESKV